MASNFNSFNPYHGFDNKFSETIFISAEDRLEEIIVDLRELECAYEGETDQPWLWPNLSLEGYKQIKMYVKKYQTEELHVEVRGVPLQPLEDGFALFRFPGEAFGKEVGKYIGLVEVEYKGSDTSGSKIITARNFIPFEVREEFYCDPFDPDFIECVGGK